MKHKYSVYCPVWKRLLKDRGISIPFKLEGGALHNGILDRLQSITGIEASNNAGEDPESVRRRSCWGNAALSGMDEYEVLLQVKRHYFIDDPMLEQFFVDTAPALSKDMDDFTTDLSDMGTEIKPDRMAYGPGSAAFFLHFPDTTKQSMLVFSLPKAGHSALHIFRGSTTWLCLGWNAPLEVGCARDSFYFRTAGKFRELKILSGFLAYARCFPEAVHPGLPDIIAHPAHFKKTENRTVGMLPEIRSTIAHDAQYSVNPHYRKAHYRILRAPRFTHKRWEEVFVHGCFVKGEAMLVENVDKMEKDNG